MIKPSYQTDLKVTSIAVLLLASGCGFEQVGTEFSVAVMGIQTLRWLRCGVFGTDTKLNFFSFLVILVVVEKRSDSSNNYFEAASKTTLDVPA